MEEASFLYVILELEEFFLGVLRGYFFMDFVMKIMKGKMNFLDLMMNER
jgi:hypothetical protein